ncbi:conserved hypothetical protein [Sulfolobus islandicus Y.N.15.51]|jgi:hypothetical protein|uniref:Uncharacterized protein n=1 Tax=Saccharolobus islandicus (strain Y.N.15.51 / Yellowstone \|nr:hypothetical protein [Sulfolobus islandicus]ACP48399.1 conserved hypothetical protein [Sulfolobus islandicus Y.N.15.51]
MKVTGVTAKYKAKIGSNEILIEEAKNEKGESIYIFTSVKGISLPNGEKWTPKTDDAKDLDRNNVTEDFKKNFRKVVQLL